MNVNSHYMIVSMFIQMGMYVPLGPCIQFATPNAYTDMCFHPRKWVVTRLKRYLCVCYTAEYVGFVQGALTLSHLGPWVDYFWTCRRKNGKSQLDRLYYYLITNSGQFVALLIMIVMLLVPRRTLRRLISTMMVCLHPVRPVENGGTDEYILDDTYVSPTCCYPTDIFN